MFILTAHAVYGVYICMYVCMFLEKNVLYLLCLCVTKKVCNQPCLCVCVCLLFKGARPHYLRSIKLGALFIVAGREKERESESPAC